MQVMHRFFARACAVAAAGVALGMWAVPTASASGGGSAAIHHGAGGPAGLVAPRFTSTDRAIAPGTSIAVHRSLSAAFVFVGCVNGAASYFPGLVVNGREKDYTSTPFAAGDVIDVTTKVSTNRTRVQVTDVTTGVTEKKIRAGGSARATFIGDDGWADSSGKLEHVPDFGKLKFRNSFVDGKTLASRHPQAFQRVNSLGTVQIAVGSLSSTGIAFATRFEH